jgi:plasmid stabilization system protein ParE
MENIYLYNYETSGEQQADRYRDRLFAIFEQLSKTPHLGPVYRGTTRRFVSGQHLIYYRIQRDGIIIARIDHGRQRRY